MTGKLIKYEMKAFSRIMGPLYGALLALALAGGIGLKIMSAEHVDWSENITGPGADIFFSAFLLMTLLAVVIMVTLTVLLVLRFYRMTSGGSESYLMFTLPVRTSALIASKALSALICILLTAAAAAAAGLSAKPAVVF